MLHNLFIHHRPTGLAAQWGSHPVFAAGLAQSSAAALELFYTLATPLVVQVALKWAQVDATAVRCHGGPAGYTAERDSDLL